MRTELESLGGNIPGLDFDELLALTAQEKTLEPLADEIVRLRFNVPEEHEAEIRRRILDIVLEYEEA